MRDDAFQGGSRLRFARAALLVVAAGLFAWPLAAMLITSVSARGSGLSAGLGASDLGHFENYARALERMGGVGRLFANTLLVTLVSIAGQVLCCSLAGYAFARIAFRGRDLLFALVLLAMLVPEQVATIPRFLLFRGLGMYDTYYPLVLPTILGGAPLFVFLFRQYFLSLPGELVEAARVDGSSHLGIWWRVYLPLARPMVVTVAIVTFLATWNDFWSPLVYLLSDEKRTLSLALASFQRTYDTAVEWMMAASVIVLAPCLLVHFAAERLFLRGVRVAASKH